MSVAPTHVARLAAAARGLRWVGSAPPSVRKHSFSSYPGERVCAVLSWGFSRTASRLPALTAFCARSFGSAPRLRRGLRSFAYRGPRLPAPSPGRDYAGQSSPSCRRCGVLGSRGGGVEGPRTHPRARYPTPSRGAPWDG